MAQMTSLKEPSVNKGDPPGDHLDAEQEEMEENGDEMKKSSSRFKVARVDFVDEAKQDAAVDGVFTNTNDTRGPESPSATFSLNSDSYHSHHTYDTNLKTFVMNTHEALPCVDHYRNILSAGALPKSRPTLAMLHEEMDDPEGRSRKTAKEPLLSTAKKQNAKVIIEGPDNAKDSTSGAIKFGWIKGVLVRCLLNIWGVMLFIRLSWVVGQAGVGYATLIILLSGVVTTVTALSMSAICTNGVVKGGGAYYMISRSLGPEFGGAIGLIFSVANAVAVAMYVVGFAETVRDILKTHDALMVDELNDIRIIGTITIIILLAIAIIGMEWEARAQLILLAVLIIALVNFFVGTLIPPTTDKMKKGFVGYSAEAFRENFIPGFRDGEGFFTVFSVFFPAATGILAGANISGDLKDAQHSIPKGTLLSIFITTITYIGVAWILGSIALRDAIGQCTSMTNATSVAACFIVGNNTAAGLDIFSVIKNCTLTNSGPCKYGLMNDYQLMEMVSGFGPLITAGIFSATLSSALASLVSAPKVFQAVCKDRIFPKIHVFGKGYGKGDNPRLAYLLTFGIGLGFICIGDLNAIAPVISNFFLMSYALINYSVFDASLARSPGWRPAFRFYNMWVSLAGAVICLIVMFIINWITALATFGIIAALFVYVHYRKPDVNWGSSTQAHVYRNALQSTLKLISVEDHIKNFRPQVLVLTGFPENRPALVDFVSHITKKIGLMVCGNVIVGTQSDNLKSLKSEAAYTFLKKKHVKAFYAVNTAPSFRLGVQSLMQGVGIGKLRPNMLIMGFKRNWQGCDRQFVEDYFRVIHDAFDLKYGVGVLRLKEGFGLDGEFDPAMIQDVEDDVSDDGSSPEDTPSLQDHEVAPMPRVDKDLKLNKSSQLKFSKNSPVNVRSQEINMDVLKTINVFNTRKERGSIDVWWLFDDGGLTLLIPYLLSRKSHWRGCKLRVFTAGTKKGDLDREQRQMATLLTKFRIEYKDMTVLPDINKSPREESVREFKNLIQGWILDEKNGETATDFPWKTNENEIEMLKEKTNRHIKIRELLIENSTDASLIVLTLPIPRKGVCSPGLYMAWLDTLTRDMPPILLLRGNQESVLTYYS